MTWTYEQRGEWEFRHRYCDQTTQFLAEARRGEFAAREAINCIDEPFDVDCYFVFADSSDEAMRKLSKEVLS